MTDLPNRSDGMSLVLGSVWVIRESQLPPLDPCRSVYFKRYVSEHLILWYVSSRKSLDISQGTFGSRLWLVWYLHFFDGVGAFSWWLFCVPEETPRVSRSLSRTRGVGLIFEVLSTYESSPQNNNKGTYHLLIEVSIKFRVVSNFRSRFS